MSPKNSSLAFEETVKELEEDIFNPQFTVIVNANFEKKSNFSLTGTDQKLLRDESLVQVKGSITISF